MDKEILFLCGSYCPDLESLKTLFVQQCYDESFREELLTFYADGVLARWLKERNVDFAMEPIEIHSDIALFKSIYQSVLGTPCIADLSCDLFKYAELVSFQAGEISRPIKIGDSQQIEMKGNRLSFVFRQKKAGNEVFQLSLKKDNKIIETQELLLDTESNGQDRTISFQLEPKTRKVELVEGGNNVICSLTKLENDLEITYYSSYWYKTFRLKLYHINSKFYLTEVITDESEVYNITGYNNFECLQNGIGFEGSQQILELLNEKYPGWKFKFPTVEQLKTALNMLPFSNYKGKYSFHLGNYNHYPYVSADLAVAFVAEKQ